MAPKIAANLHIPANCLRYCSQGNAHVFHAYRNLASTKNLEGWKKGMVGVS